MRTSHETKLNYAGKAFKSVAYECKISYDEYKVLRQLAMRGFFSWNFDYQVEKETLRITCQENLRRKATSEKARIEATLGKYLDFNGPLELA